MASLIGAALSANNLQVAFIGNGDRPWSMWRDGAGQWRDGGPLPSDTATAAAFSQVATVNSANGDFHALLIGHPDGQLYVSVNWGVAAKFPLPIAMTLTALAVDIGVDGRIQVFVVDQSHSLHLIQQSFQDSHQYNYIKALTEGWGVGVKAIATSRFSEGKLQVYLLDAGDGYAGGGHPYVIQQVSATDYGAPVALDNPGRLAYQWLSVGPSSTADTVNVFVLDGNAGKPYLIEQTHAVPAGVNRQNPCLTGETTFVQCDCGVGQDGTGRVVLLDTAGQACLIGEDRDSGVWSLYPDGVNGALPTQMQKPTFAAVGAVAKAGDASQVICLDACSNQPFLIEPDGQGGWAYGGPVPYVTQVVFTDVQAAAGNDGNMQVVALGSDGQLYLNWQDEASGAWHKFDLLPIPAKQDTSTMAFALAVGGDGNLQLIAITFEADVVKIFGAVKLIWQNRFSGVWTLATDCAMCGYGVPSDAVVACLGPQGLWALFRGAHATGVPLAPAYSGKLYGFFHDSQGVWSSPPPTQLDLSSSKVALAQIIANGNGGSLQTIFVGGDDLPHLNYNYTPNNAWSYFTDPFPFDNQGRPQVLAASHLGMAGDLWVIFQVDNKLLATRQNPDGAWSAFGPLNAADPASYLTMSATPSLGAVPLLFVYAINEDNVLMWIQQKPDGAFTIGEPYVFGDPDRDQGFTPPPATIVKCAPFGRDGDNRGFLLLMIGLNDGRVYFEDNHRGNQGYGLLP